MTRCAHCWTETYSYFFVKFLKFICRKLFAPVKTLCEYTGWNKNHFSIRCIDVTVQVTMKWFPPKCSERSTEWRFRCWLNVFVNSINLIIQQVLSSSWNGRPFGHKRHGLKSRGMLCLFFGGRRWSEAKATAGHKHWRKMDLHSLRINYFTGYEMSIAVCNWGGKTGEAKWLMET